MEVRKTLKYRLYHSKRNKHLNQRIDIAGLIWNHMVALQRRTYRLTGSYITKNAMQKHLAKLRRRNRFSHWKLVGSQAVQQLAKRHDNAYQRFFDYKKNGGIKCGRPNFMKVKKYKSFTLKQAGWRYLGGNKLKIHGKVHKFSLSRPVEGTIKTVTIKRDNLRKLWVCFSVIQEVADMSTAKNGRVRVGGFDFGLAHFLTDQRGKRHSNPQFLKADLNKIAKLNRALSLKQAGGSGRKKAKLALARAHQTIANKRKDWQWKKAHRLADQYDALFFEELNLAGMKKLWGRKVSDLGFADFLAIQKQVCQKRGKLFAQTGRWEATTKPCCRCGTRHVFDLSVRDYHCSSCDLIIDRDWNASINIAVAGASATGLGNVRRKLLSAIPARPLESHPL